jgi:hypothetical protein
MSCRDLENPAVRGEPVVIVEECAVGEQRYGVLGYTRADATVLVEYPGGERGYVIPAQITEGAGA